jgi:abortive infection bacteriophage resistance protein
MINSLAFIHKDRLLNSKITILPTKRKSEDEHEVQIMFYWISLILHLLQLGGHSSQLGGELELYLQIFKQTR